MLTRRLAVAVISLALVAALPTTAHADDPAPGPSGSASAGGGGLGAGANNGGQGVNDPSGSTGGSTGGGSTGGTSTGGKPGGCTSGGKKVPCQSVNGSWSASRACWVSLASPQPPADDPLWDGHTTGHIYTCIPDSANSTGMDISYDFWADSQPATGNPQVAANAAYDEARRKISSPQLGMTPLVGQALVGTDTWLWLDNPASAFGTVSATASVPGFQVTATLTATEVTWELGDGTTVTCRNPGTKWTAAKGEGPSPTCGHRYLAEGDMAVAATVRWEGSWASSDGRFGGDFTPLQMTDTRAMSVVEMQVLRSY